MHLPPNTIIASGPVIIENGRVLLNREQKEEYVTDWLFPGGEVEDFDSTLEEACTREVKEEMGIEIQILKPLRPILFKHEDRVIILIHFLAERIGEITPGAGIVEYAWHDIHNLPDNCAPNVYDIIHDIEDRV
jgi:mutator protein MutT